MQAKTGVIDLLNRILTADLTAINQYFVHAKMCQNWGMNVSTTRSGSVASTKCGMPKR